MKEDLHLRELNLQDTVIGPTKSYILDFCREALRQGLDFSYLQGNLRADLVRKDVLRMMRQIGFKRVGLGMESANDRILQMMGKRTTVKAICRAIDLIKSEGLAIDLSCMVGQPTETLEEFNNTVRLFMRATDAFHPTFCDHDFGPLITFPGTAIYQYGLENGYFADEEDFYGKFFSGKYPGWINYTRYPDEVVEFYFRTGYFASQYKYARAQVGHWRNRIMADVLSARDEAYHRDVAGGVALDQGALERGIQAFLAAPEIRGKRVLLYGVSDLTLMIRDRIACGGDGTRVAGFARPSLVRPPAPFRIQGCEIIGADALEQPLEDLDPASYDVVAVADFSMAGEDELHGAASRQFGGEARLVRGSRYMTFVQWESLSRALESVMADIL
jgi:hypothetical protein